METNNQDILQIIKAHKAVYQFKGVVVEYSAINATNNLIRQKGLAINMPQYSTAYLEYLGFWNMVLTKRLSCLNRTITKMS